MAGVSKIDTVENVALVSFSDIPANVTMMADIFSAFAEEEIVIDMISQTPPVADRISISFTCLEIDMVRVLAASRKLFDRYPGLRPMVSSGNGKISVFGEDMPTEYGVFSTLLRCLSQAGLELRQITTSEVDISLLLPSEQLDTAEKAIRAAFMLA